MDVQSIILTAKIGGERKAAQEDTCGPFAAALYDVLTEQGIPASIKTAAFIVLPGSQASWYHAVVEVDGRYYDSKGEFSHEIVRQRLKTHPKATTRIDFKADDRDSCYEDELDELHQFLVKALRKSIEKHRLTSAASQAA